MIHDPCFLAFITAPDAIASRGGGFYRQFSLNPQNLTHSL
jgi:hypothetical protein